MKAVAEFACSIPAFVEAIASPEDGVRIWIAHLELISSTDMAELNSSLTSAEHVRAAKFHFERDRQHFIGARGILRRLLSAALEIPAHEVVFQYGPHGKPAILALDGDERTLRFNISHAHGWAMFALVWGREVGIDLEAAVHLTDKGKTLSELAARILSPRELEIWRALPDDGARTTNFLRAWTRKEAYIKGTGEGLFGGLQTIEVALDAARPQASLTMPASPGGRKMPRDWTIHDLPAPGGFAAAIAIERVGY
jgi:4'-phosphopantetheinyl transferase